MFGQRKSPFSQATPACLQKLRNPSLVPIYFSQSGQSHDNGKNMSSEAEVQAAKASPSFLSHVLQTGIASLVLFWSGFFTTDFLLSGLYTWPRASRVIILTLAVIILSYEFVYKEQRARAPMIGTSHLKVIFYFCLLPYMAGTLALLGLVNLQ